MTRKVDIILFGATGYTGKCTLSQLNKLAKNFTWGIAGRNEEKLRKVLKEAIIDGSGSTDLSVIPIIVADVNDEESIRNMTDCAKVVVNCCGPFDLYGEVVVKACIDSGTHYVDVTGEVQFMDRILIKYKDSAEKKGIFIVNGCGIEYVLSDLGLCFVENQWQGGTINSAETFVRSYEEDATTLPALANVGTWASVVHFLGNASTYFFNQRALNKPLDPLCKPKLNVKLIRKVNNGWACFSPTPDKDVVHRSQLFFYEKFNKRPIQMNTYTIVSSLKYILLCMIYIPIVFLIGQIQFGRSILLKYPEFFTNGLVQHQPSEDRMKKLRFVATFKCQGWNEAAPKSDGQFLVPPNKEMVAQISGFNPGYGFTAVSVILSALIILTEINKLPEKGGVYTPAMAFSKTSMIQQLQNNGVDFKVVSVKDI